MFVPEAEDFETLRIQERGAGFVVSACGGFVVLAAVEFDDEFRAEGCEVGDVRAEADLTAEVEAAPFEVAQQGPEPLFGFGLIGAEMAGKVVGHVGRLERCDPHP